MEKSKVYFCRETSPETLVKLYKLLGVNLKGNVAVKLHSGEQGNRNYLKPEFVKPMVDYVNGTVVECNTAYGGARNSTEKHIKLIKEHKWDEVFKFDLMDAEGPDMVLQVENPLQIKENLVGKDLAKYDSMLVLSHFKGHAMGGFGGALKQLSIGVSSSAGKTRIHSAGVTDDQTKLWDNLPEQDAFLEAMSDAASSVVKHFNGNMAFINCMVNISVDCDCDGNAAPPCMQNIGILASLDPIAIDQACLDLVDASNDPGKPQLIERIDSRHGRHTVEVSEGRGFGTRNYELIEVE